MVSRKWAYFCRDMNQILLMRRHTTIQNKTINLEIPLKILKFPQKTDSGMIHRFSNIFIPPTT